MTNQKWDNGNPDDTGHDIVMGEFQQVQIFGRKGDLVNSKICLESAKRIWEELKDVDETVSTHLEYYEKNYDHLMKNFK